MHRKRRRKGEKIFVKISNKEYTSNLYILKQILMKKYYYKFKSGKTLIRQKRMTKKLSPTEAHLIVKDYIKIQAGRHKVFRTVKELLKARWISRNVPSKLVTKFKLLWWELYTTEKIDYRKNIFLERS